MSVVTTVVFVTNSWDDKERYLQLVADLYTRYGNVDGLNPYELHAAESDGPKCAAGYVYYTGFNHMDVTLSEALQDEKWADPTTVLWMQHEEFSADVFVGTEQHRWHRHPDQGIIDALGKFRK